MPYLTVEQYVARFGEMETILLTNEAPSVPDAPSGYDSAKVDAAISDAGEVVEGYIGGRYVIPIADPPRIVQGWTAALAREALYVNEGRVSEAVTLAADRARAQLRDVQAAKMSLPIAEGSTAPDLASPAGTAMSSNDRECPTFVGTGALDAYSAPFLGSPLPCWRQ